MTINPAISTSSELPLSSMVADTIQKDQELGKACDQFEGMLIRQILADGLKPMLATPPGSGAPGANVYDYMLTDILAKGISGKSAMGISHLLQAQLQQDGVTIK